MEAPDPVGDSHDGEGVTSDGGSTALQSEAGPSGVSEREAKKNRRRQLLKKKVQQFELKLADYDRQIKKVTETELTLEEMDSDTSAYLMEDALKRRFMRTWYRLCELLHMDPEIKTVHKLSEDGYQGTPHSQLNRRVDRLVALNEFPDHYDVCQMVDRVNEKHSLGLEKEERVALSRQVFKEVGKILQGRRRQEFRESFGCHLTDCFAEDDDPAIKDAELQDRLAQSARDGEERLAQLCEQFAVRQETEGDATGTSGNEEEGKDEEEQQDQPDMDPSSSTSTDTHITPERSPHKGTHITPERSPTPIHDNTLIANSDDDNSVNDDDIEIVTATRTASTSSSNSRNSSPHCNGTSPNNCIIIIDSDDDDNVL